MDIKKQIISYVDKIKLENLESATEIYTGFMDMGKISIDIYFDPDNISIKMIIKNINEALEYELNKKEDGEFLHKEWLKPKYTIWDWIIDKKNYLIAVLFKK